MRLYILALLVAACSPSSECQEVDDCYNPWNSGGACCLPGGEFGMCVLGDCVRQDRNPGEED